MKICHELGAFPLTISIGSKKLDSCLRTQLCTYASDVNLGKVLLGVILADFSFFLFFQMLKGQQLKTSPAFQKDVEISIS